MKKIRILTALLCLSIGTWAAEATITATDGSTYASAYYLPADGTAITAVVGAGAKSITYNKGAKITVDKKNNPSATITFTIPSGVTITSFKVNGTNQNNTAYDLDGTSVTFGTALTSLSKTSSMVFTLTCTDTSPSSTSNRNTTITSIDLVYSTGGGGGGCSSPSITNPVAATYNRGATATALDATATATNPGTISYQWKQCATADGSYTNVASGGTSASYTPSTTTVGTMYYKCVASFSGGCTAQTSSAALITVNCATPTITTQPVADTHCQTDADYELSVTPTAQTGATFTYQWQKSTDNGSSEAFANIGGATSSSYTVPDATLLADTDKQIYYRCVVTCNIGSKSANSNSVAVKALLTPGLSISLKP